MSRVLVVDDKEMMRDSVATTLARRGHTVVTAPSAQAALEKLLEKRVDAVVTDLQMPDMDGVALLAEIRKLDEQLPVVLMTAYGTVESAVAALKLGAYDYISKPFSGDALVATMERAMEHASLVRENSILRASGIPGASESASGTPRTSSSMVGGGGWLSHEMIGTSSVMQEIHGRLGRIADSQGTVLISGESGSGKEVAARWIHAHSPRAFMPFLAINCAALSTNLLESELFGHEKGAFTGADKLRKGRFELADGGTLLLDEISEIGPEIQAKLLRVLQERSYERVGSSSSRSVDVRVIATTNRDLPAEVARGRFRQDLFYRLNVLPLMMPALREHPQDISELASHFLGRVAQREGRAVKRFADDALDLLARYPWPGNVRELQNICERAWVLTTGETIPATLIAPWLASAGPSAYMPASALSTAAHPRAASGAALPGSIVEVREWSETAGDVLETRVPTIVCAGELTLEQIEREVIVRTLQANRGHRQKSAVALGIGVRTLGLKLKKWKELQLVASEL